MAQQRLPAVAIAIRPVGDRPPSTEEIRQTYEALQSTLLRAGASVAERRDVTDFVIPSGSHLPLSHPVLRDNHQYRTDGLDFELQPTEVILLNRRNGVGVCGEIEG